ncbi:MAG: hypothetical protein LC781_11810 [Actinobacteria bacterium]|nr:hypothetical protein [Actinomycetota bacterium]
MNNEWITVANAASILGVSKQAIRQRIYRDTIAHRKDHDGTVFVRITEHNPEANGETNGESYAENIGHTEDVSRELIDELRERIGFVERQLEQANERDRENRRIIAGLVQRVPELEAVSEPRDAPDTASEDANRDDVPPEPQEPAERRSWLYRFFFGP